MELERVNALMMFYVCSMLCFIYIFFLFVIQPAKHTPEEVAMRFSEHSPAINACVSFGDQKTWKFLRQKVLEIQGDRCLCCGKRAESMHIDHIKPKSRYPHLEYMIDNLQVLCPSCNKKKSSVGETDYRKSNHLITLLREVKFNKLLQRKYIYNIDVLEQLAEKRFQSEIRMKDYPQILPIS